MRVLLLGYSSIVRRRVLPALARTGVVGVDVATRSAAGEVTLPQGLTGQVFDDYGEALRKSEAGLVYISTVNSLHAELAGTALERGYHVVIDKPAATDLSGVQRLIRLAGQRGRLLAEANVYGYHPQIEVARRVFAEIGSRPAQLVSAFSFPPLPPGNYRHDPKLGGGMLLDLGCYAITPGRFFFGEAPLEIICRWSKRPGEKVDCAFSLLATYPGGRSLVGHFGTTTGYVNRLEVLGPHATVSIERVFTTPPNMTCELRVNQHNKFRTITVPPADNFALFLGAVLEGIQSGRTQPFAEAMLADAEALERLRTSARPWSPRVVEENC